MNELTNLRALGAILGAAVGSGLGIVAVLLVVLPTALLRINWPVAHPAVLLAALGLPIVVTSFVGIICGPAIPSWLSSLSRRLEADQAMPEATAIDASRPLELHISRRFTVMYVLAGLVVTALGVVLVAAGVAVGWLCVVFSGPITLLQLVQFIWPNHFGLTLDDEGFTVTMNLGRRRYRWANVEQFFPYRTFAPQPVVAFKYRGKAEVHGLQSTRGAFGTFDGTLPQNLTVRGLALLRLMEAWRADRTSK